MTFEDCLSAEQEKREHAEAVAEAYRSKNRRARRLAERESARRLRLAGRAAAAGLAVLLASCAAPVTAPALESGMLDKPSKPALEAAAEAPEETENELIEAALLDRAHVIENCKITYYDSCVACCGKDDGITASGVQAAPYITCAVDPAVIPLGADVLVDYGDGELHYLRADDTGVIGGHIDICVTSHTEALQLGVDRGTVYWVEPS